MADADESSELVRASGDVARLFEHVNAVLHLSEDGASDGYGHLALCVIDAVFSLGVHYRQVENVVDRYCRYTGLAEIGRRGHPAADEHTLRDLIELHREHGWQKLMEEVYDNRTWTSAVGARRIRKAAAVEQFATVLVGHGVVSLLDVEEADDRAIKRDLREIPGQSSGLSYFYTLMLAGRDDYVKADRHIIRFVQQGIGRRCEAVEAARLVKQTAYLAAEERSWITPTLLDNAIWRHMAGR